MSPNTHFARMRQILRDFYSARRVNFAVTLAMATLTIIGAGCTDVQYNQAKSGNAAMQMNPNSAPAKLLPKSATATDSQLQTSALQSFQPEAKDATNSAIHSSSGESSAAINGWQYCLAPSHAEHKIYISPLFPKSAALSNTETAFAQMLLQSDAPHDDVQCPNSNDEHSISSMRQRAINFNRKAGNMIVTLNWEPLKFSQPDAANDNIYTGNGGPSTDINGSVWQYCLAPSQAEHKIYISPLFPKSAALSNTETAFNQMLVKSKIRHDDVQCPNGNDEDSISSMRQTAISFNHKVGNTIITLDWNP